MLDVKVRPYQASDYDSVCGIHDAARKIELALAALDGVFLPFTVAAERESFFDYPHIDVATVNDTVVGFSAYTDEEYIVLIPKLRKLNIFSFEYLDNCDR